MPKPKKAASLSEIRHLNTKTSRSNLKKIIRERVQSSLKDYDNDKNFSYTVRYITDTLYDWICGLEDHKEEFGNYPKLFTIHIQGECPPGFFEMLLNAFQQYIDLKEIPTIVRAY